jgi:hypothetical protein
MLFRESLELVRGRVISRAKMQPRFLVLPAEIHGLQRPAGQGRFNRKQNGSVAIPHIPFGPLKVRRRGCFFQRILRVNRPVFGLSAFRAPAATRHVVLERPIQRRPVSAGLAPGNKPS